MARSRPRAAARSAHSAPPATHTAGRPAERRLNTNTMKYIQRGDFSIRTPSNGKSPALRPGARHDPSAARAAGRLMAFISLPAGGPSIPTAPLIMMANTCAWLAAWLARLSAKSIGRALEESQRAVGPANGGNKSEHALSARTFAARSFTAGPTRQAPR